MNCRHPKDTASSEVEDGLVRLVICECESCFLLGSG